MSEPADRRWQALECAEPAIDWLRQALEAPVAERTLALQRRVEELETMNATMSHDLRTPLASVINFAAILGEGYGTIPDEAAYDCLRRISSNARTAVALLDHLLAFSQSGREEMHMSHVDVRRLVEGVREDLIGNVASARGRVEIAELPHAYADPAMIRRVFANLISNALKFVKKGEAARIEIGGSSHAGEPVYFVRDQGIGFDMGCVDRLFEVFGRLRPTEFEGHGIGLATVARLVRRHGGRVWAESTEGSGATFLFSLPAASPGQRDPHARNGTPSGKSHNGAASRA